MIDADGVRAGLSRAGIKLSDEDFAGLLTETIEHATRVEAREETHRNWRTCTCHYWNCPPFPTGWTWAASTNWRKSLRSRASDERGEDSRGESMSAAPATLDMKSILSDKVNRVVVCCGAGGIDKTTTAAAMALRAAEVRPLRGGADHRPGPQARAGVGIRNWAMHGASLSPTVGKLTR